MTKGWFIPIVIFASFMVEAIAHYNIGKYGWREKGKWSMPSREHMMPVFLTVGIFTLFSSALIDLLGGGK